MKRLFQLLLGMLVLPLCLMANDANHAKDLYLNLIKKCVLGRVYCDPPKVNDWETPIPSKYGKYLEVVFPYMQTGVTESALDTLRFCMEEVEKHHIPGDFIETGVWRGGVTIFMKAFIRASGDKERKVWVADSFQGFPPSDRPDEATINNEQYPHFMLSADTVRANFARYHLLDDRVCFLEGFFNETLPQANIEKLAILRLDGDLYSSTMDVLTLLYPKLSVGGYIIIDDYGAFPGCAEAVHDYMKLHNIQETISWEDWQGIYWKKTK